MLDITRPWEAHIDQRLRADPIIWLASTRPDGRPHVVPVWFLYDGTTILSFSLPAAQKVRTLCQNPAVMLALASARHGNEIIMLERRATCLTTPRCRPRSPRLQTSTRPSGSRHRSPGRTASRRRSVSARCALLVGEARKPRVTLDEGHR